MTTIPDFMPVLSAGKHLSPREGACFMEYVSVITGDKWTDKPSSVHPTIRHAAIAVNDYISDDDRHLLLPLVHRVIGTSRQSESGLQLVINIMLDEQYRRTYRELRTGPSEARVAALVRLIELWEEWSGYGAGQPILENHLRQAAQRLNRMKRSVKKAAILTQGKAVWMPGATASIDLADWDKGVGELLYGGPVFTAPLNDPIMTK